MNAAAGMVITQAQTIRLARPQRTAWTRRADDSLVQGIGAALLQPNLPQRAGGGNLKLWVAGRPVVAGFSPVRGSEPGAVKTGWLVMVVALVMILKYVLMENAYKVIALH